MGKKYPFLVAACAGAGAPAGAEPAELARVIDGDTAEFILGDSTELDVRFILIETPETVAPNQPVACFGEEASAFAEFLLTLPADI
jgi:micrococcal nuclease